MSALDSPIDITLTAVQRPDILRQTLESFAKYVIADTSNLRLLINIDPVGDGTADQTEEICRQYFQHRLVRRPAKPSLNEAIKWLWRQTQTDIVLHWEDDHTAVRPINFVGMIEAFSANPRLAYLQLPRIDFDRPDIFNDKLIQHRYWKPNLYRRSGDYKMSFGCGLMRRTFIIEAAKLIHLQCDPEIQFHVRNPELKAWADRWEYATWVKPDQHRACRDIGKQTRADSGWQKVQSDRGTIWQRKT